MTELVDGPQIDPGGVQRKPVAVVKTGVFPKSVQEYHGRARVRAGPVPVVHRAIVMVEEGHALNCTRFVANTQLANARPANEFYQSRRILKILC